MHEREIDSSASETSVRPSGLSGLSGPIVDASWVHGYSKQYTDGCFPSSTHLLSQPPLHYAGIKLVHTIKMCLKCQPTASQKVCHIMLINDNFIIVYSQEAISGFGQFQVIKLLKPIFLKLLNVALWLVIQNQVIMKVAQQIHYMKCT